MKEIVVLSGKGGTGKTCITAALADLISCSSRVVLVDSDVDAANLGLICDPTTKEEHCFFGGRCASIDPTLCTSCGTCREVCRFDAIVFLDGTYRVVAQNCEGCDACIHQCQAEAIASSEQQAGLWFQSMTRYGPLLHAHLLPGAENSGKLVATIKRRGRELASLDNYPLMLVDGPPGTGCPVISAVAGADHALLVTEPTVAAIHDLDRILQVVQHFGIPASVVLNKADLYSEGNRWVRDFCIEFALELICEIPFDPAVPAAMASGFPITRFGDGSPAADAIKRGLRSFAALLHRGKGGTS